MDEMIRNNQVPVIEQYFAMKSYEEAVPYIQLLLGENPNDAAALYFMAVVELSRENFHEVRVLCERAMLNGYDEERCFYVIATTYREEKNYREAENAYLKALEISPHSAEVHASYGYLMFITGYEEKAIRLLEEAMRIDPSSDQVNQYVLLFYFAKSDEENQLARIKQIMETSSSEVQKLVNLAIYHDLRQQPKQAREFARQAFLLDPTSDHLLGVLETLDEQIHPLFLPIRWMQKVGGPAVVWIGFMVMSFILSWLNQDTILLVFVVSYILFCIYTWIAQLLYQRFVKERLA
ncbi:tetratricopeptide repeat protein [Bacillus sp. 2205SS5-2]|uniref:tetratricopeptide repeat protein n=1 Tax=Bacillus sp. 2205SS5-2 TaxID=3109031 RepID=UPI0030042AC1